MSESSDLPPKTEVALALLQTALSVYVHLDPRPKEVRVPASFKKQAQLVLQVGLNMAVPIPDLDVGTEALTCTLSFNRKAEFCWIPWSAVYGLVGDDGRGMIWPDSVPPEVAAAAEGRPTTSKSDGKRAHLRLQGEASATPEARPKGTRASKKASAARSAEASSPAARAVPPIAPQRARSASQDDQAKPAAADTAQRADEKTSGAAPRERKRELPPYLRIVK